MRVLVTIFESLVPTSRGGTPRISNVVKAFARRGHEVYVASCIAVSVEEAKRELELSLDGGRWGLESSRGSTRG
jgi:hypothetical protein